jgi:hypothetical protein
MFYYLCELAKCVCIFCLAYLHEHGVLFCCVGFVIAWRGSLLSMHAAVLLSRRSIQWFTVSCACPVPASVLSAAQQYVLCLSITESIL